jgi:hypothetical protein
MFRINARKIYIETKEKKIILKGGVHNFDEKDDASNPESCLVNTWSK